MKIEDSNLNINLNTLKNSATQGIEEGQPFADFLKDSLAKVNSMELEADKVSQQLVTGEIADIHQVMIATEKAGIAMQFAIQVRNRLIEAYQEIMRMQM